MAAGSVSNRDILEHRIGEIERKNALMMNLVSNSE